MNKCTQVISNLSVFQTILVFHKEETIGLQSTTCLSTYDETHYITRASDSIRTSCEEIVHKQTTFTGASFRRFYPNCAPTEAKPDGQKSSRKDGHLEMNRLSICSVVAAARAHSDNKSGERLDKWGKKQI